MNAWCFLEETLMSTATTAANVPPPSTAETDPETLGWDLR